MGRDLRSLPRTARTLTVLVVVVFVVMTTLSAAIVAIVNQAGDAGKDLARSQTMLITLDELNESLRGDVLAILSADPADRSGSTADLARLRQLLDGADLGPLPAHVRARVLALLADERRYTDILASAFGGTGPDHTEHIRPALTLVASLTDEVDAVRTELDAVVAGQHQAAQSTVRLVVLILVGSAAAVAIVTVLVMRRALLGGLRQAAGDLQRNYDDQEQGARVDRALDQTENESDVYGVVARATALVSSNAPSQLLLSDASEVHLERLAVNGEAAGGCGVTTPSACLAIRGGRTVLTPSSGEIDACPRLRDRPGETVSAACTPVTFLGKSLGVLQVIGQDHCPPDEHALAALGNLAHTTGSRIGTMRALALAQRQATIDPLTGLLNRRTLEDRTHALSQSGTPYAVAMLDLDHFKSLNDTYGHEVGDRALKVFSRLLRDTLRKDDVVSRYGGEEFVVVFPGTDSAGALEALQHVRQALALSSAETGVAFTFSGGVSDTQASQEWRQLLRIADAGLMACKQNGRDQVAVGRTLGEERRQVA